MKPLARFSLIGVGLAAVVAVASALYLRESHEAVRRVIQPVELSAPDLFPADTILYTEMSGWDQSYARAEAWWKRFEGTAAWLALQRGWKENKLGLPEPFLQTLEKTEKELDRVEERFGYRPTTREFFESYGKHIAIGILPAPKGERPRLLLATRLPENAPRELQGYLAKAGGVKPCDPPMHQGFPVFQEAQGEATIFYGVGRGYLFLSESLPDLQGSLDRLALATDGDSPKKPEGTLAGDPVLARVRPAPGQGESGVIYIRRDPKFGEWTPELAPVDEFIRNAFVLAPKDDAVAFSLPDSPNGEVRCSFHSGAPKPWTATLPAGLTYLEATVPVAKEDLRKAQDAEAAALFDRPIWKELDAFLSDPKKLKAFLEEALPEDERPDDELIARLPHDVRLAGAWAKESLQSAVNLSAPQFAMAQKVFAGTDGAQSTQMAFGLELDPFSIFLIAGGLDFARSTWPDWVARVESPGVLSWSLDMKQALRMIREEAPPEMLNLVETYVTSLAPSILISGNRVFMVFGAEFAKEIASPQPTFDEDPLFIEARGQVRPGFSYLSWDRPWERIRAGWGTWLEWIESMLAQQGHDEAQAEFIGAGLKTVHKAIGWGKPLRASLTARYLDPAKPSESADLIDPAAEKGVPRLVPADAPARSPDFLPAETWLYLMQRIETRPSYDALRETFVAALPGGEERLKGMRAEADPEAAARLDAMIEGLVRNVKGEVGIAILTPRVKPMGGEPPSFQAVAARFPAVVAFAEFEKPVDAFHAARRMMETVHQAIAPPDVEGYRDVDEPPPFRAEMKVGMIGEFRAAALDLFIPMEPEPAVVSLCVAERGGFLFFTTSGEVLKRFGSAKEKDDDSLAARLAKALPAEAAPGDVSSMTLFHGDTLVAQVRLYLEFLAQTAPMLTLRGYPDGPPMDRLQAHADGWMRWIDLALDLFKTRSWSVGTTSRTGNVIRSKRVVCGEKE